MAGDESSGEKNNNGEFVQVDHEEEHQQDDSPGSGGASFEEVVYEEQEEAYEENEEQQEEEVDAADNQPEQQSKEAPEPEPAAAATEEGEGEDGEEQNEEEEIEEVEEEEVEEVEEVEEEEEEGAVATDASAAATSSTPAVPSASSPGLGGSAGVDLDLKHLEEQAAKVAKDVQAAAKDVSTKLAVGLKSALGGAAEATSSLTKMTAGLSSWWSSLDPVPQQHRDEQAERVQASGKASSELQAMFGLSPEENLVEQFKCKLLQTYGCNHNNFTPAIQMAFQGSLYITDKHTCFSVEERGRKLPFKVPHATVIKAVRQRPPRKGDLSDLLIMEMDNGTKLVFKDFTSGGALDSALALIEHLMEG